MRQHCSPTAQREPVPAPLNFSDAIDVVGGDGTRLSARLI
jgi:hypothetical protein